MLPNLNNQKRALAELVSIDAWQDAFDQKHPKVDLHADVVFGTARVGGETESKIRFRLSVRQAEVVVVIPESEPASVDKKSVARDSFPVLQGRLTETFEKKAKFSAKLKASALASITRLAGSASAEASAQAERTGSRRLKVSSAVQLMLVLQSKTDKGDYRWSVSVTPDLRKILQGRPWDAATEPRLKIIDQRKDRSKGLPPTVRVEVQCLREDLVIQDLHVKDESIWGNVKSRLGFKNRLAAAESYIRDWLLDEGLEVKNIHDSFGRLTLGSSTAQST
jgi:hypothetical protein